MRLETALALWGKPGRLLFAPGRTCPAGVDVISASPLRWSPRRRRLDSEVGVSLTSVVVQDPATPPVSGLTLLTSHGRLAPRLQAACSRPW
jgi:hypothetical protein